MYKDPCKYNFTPLYIPRIKHFYFTLSPIDTYINSVRYDLNSTEILQSRGGGNARIQIIENLLKEDLFLKRTICKICLLKTLSIFIIHLKQNNFIKRNYSLLWKVVPPLPPWQLDQTRGQAVSESEKAAVPVCLDPESALNLLLAGNFIYDGGNEKWIIDCLEKKTDFDPLLYLKMPIA